MPRKATSRPASRRDSTVAGRLTHFDRSGAAHMVDVTAKPATHRMAAAIGEIRMKPATLRIINSGRAKKGDVLGVARIAAIQGAKNAAHLIPLAHPLSLTRVQAEFTTIHARNAIALKVSAETVGPTGVEMEALAAVSAGLLTIYDMCKAVDRGMHITGIHLAEKSGGRSGHFVYRPARGLAAKKKKPRRSGVSARLKD